MSKMIRKSTVFMNGRTQAIRIPSAFRLEVATVWMWRQAGTGFLVVASRPGGWDSFRRISQGLSLPRDFPRRLPNAPQG